MIWNIVFILYLILSFFMGWLIQAFAEKARPPGEDPFHVKWVFGILLYTLLWPLCVLWIMYSAARDRH